MSGDIAVFDGRYFIAFWNFAVGDDEECLTYVYRDQSGPWHIPCRLRKVVDARTIGSADKKKWSFHTLPREAPESAVEAAVERVVLSLQAQLKGRDLHKVSCHSDQAMVVLEALTNTSIYHLETKGSG